MPRTSGISRHAWGAGGVTRRATPSGEICTRRIAIRAATAAATGTPIATTRMSASRSDRSPGSNGWPVKDGMASSSGCSSR